MNKWCWWINESQDPEVHGGFIPSQVTEDTPDHVPCPHKGSWGATLAEAKAECAIENERLGLTAERVLEIRVSSMRVSTVRR
jgi:hypothetical protein